MALMVGRFASNLIGKRGRKRAGKQKNGTRANGGGWGPRGGPREGVPTAWGAGSGTAARGPPPRAYGGTPRHAAGACTPPLPPSTCQSRALEKTGNRRMGNTLND